MDAVRLSRLTTGLVVAVGGMAAGHLLLPYGPASSPGRRLAFWAVVAALGALRGWRESALLERSARPRTLAYAFAALTLAYVANWLVHGGPRIP